MFSCYIRFVLLLIISFTIVHAYPSSMSKIKWLPTRVERPYLVHAGQSSNYLNLPNENDEDLNDSNGFATWLFRSRKFCCAPPL